MALGAFRFGIWSWRSSWEDFGATVVIHNPLIFCVSGVGTHAACAFVCWEGDCARQVLPLLRSLHPLLGTFRVLWVLP